MSDIDMKYVDYVLEFPLTRNMLKINQSIVLQTLIPLSALAEQKRTVAKIEELIPLCE